MPPYRMAQIKDSSCIQIARILFHSFNLKYFCVPPCHGPLQYIAVMLPHTCCLFSFLFLFMFPFLFLFIVLPSFFPSFIPSLLSCVLDEPRHCIQNRVHTRSKEDGKFCIIQLQTHTLHRSSHIVQQCDDINCRVRE